MCISLKGGNCFECGNLLLALCRISVVIWRVPPLNVQFPLSETRSRGKFYKFQKEHYLHDHLICQDGEPCQLLSHRFLDLALLREQDLQLEQLPLLLLELGADALHHGGVVASEPGGIIKRCGGGAEESLVKEKSRIKFKSF